MNEPKTSPKQGLSDEGVIFIKNRGQGIADTNYWDGVWAGRGLFYLTWNESAGRLLMPDSQKKLLSELRKTTNVVISSGPWPAVGVKEGLEILFEDGTNNPFCIHMVADQCDRRIPDEYAGRTFDFALWTRGGMKLRVPGKYRVVNEIPCGAP